MFVQMNVSIEYTMERNMVLDNVNIMIPLGSHDAPHVASVDGQYQHNSAEGSLLWHQDRIDSSYVLLLLNRHGFYPMLTPVLRSIETPAAL